MDIEKDLAQIARQESVLRFDRFDPEVAWEVGLALKAEAVRRGVGIAMEVSTPAYTLFSYSMAGATPDNADWIRRKRNTVFRIHRSSYAISLEAKRDGRSLAERWGVKPADYVAAGGGFPLWVGGSCIGAVVVSGVPQRDDHDIVVRSLSAVLGKPVESLPPET